jgi:cytochrome c peroxidase
VLRTPQSFVGGKVGHFETADERYLMRRSSQILTGTGKLIAIGSVLAFAGIARADQQGQLNIDGQLTRLLREAGFTGNIAGTLEKRLGRPTDAHLANIGRLLWFDKSGGLHSDNTCGGCHSPTNGFGDTQSIAIGIQNNNIVGRDRTGPRNQRRTPSVANAAFYPALMWNGRFSSLSGDPFDNSHGFQFPEPEGIIRFPALDPIITHLLIAQAHMPPTELTEVAGFTGTTGTIGPLFNQFDDGLGSTVPAADFSGFRNDPIRQAVLARLNSTPAYRGLFGAVFPSVAAGGQIDFTMFARAIAEFEFSLVFANAPVDQYARGNRDAMTLSQKRGALIFFGTGGCVSCHAVGGKSNEMFSDFTMHVAGVPQIAPFFGIGKGNVLFDGPGQDEDFGLEQITGDSTDRYAFRTSPLRNAALQPAFFHNGSFTRIEDAIRHHLNVFESNRNYDPESAGVDKDLTFRVGPAQPVLARIDPLLATPKVLSSNDFDDLVAFVRDGLLDPNATKQNLCALRPAAVPSGFILMHFQNCSGQPTP